MNTINKILIGFGALIFLNACGTAKVDEPIQSAAIDVEVMKIELSEERVKFQYAGKVVSSDQAVLSTKILGQVKKVLVDEGEKVKKGQLLVQIESTDIKAKLAAAKAGQRDASSSKSNTRKNFDRITNLFAKGSATQRELDDITSGLDRANARLETVDQQIAELNDLLAYANLRSPINGFVSQKFMNTGDMASPGRPILGLESLSKMKIEINVPEFEVDLFESGDPVTVTFNSQASKSYEGIVNRVIPSTGLSGAQFKVSIILTKPDAGIKPGMFGKVSMHKNDTHKVIIAEDLIHRRGQLQGVYTVNQQGEAMLRWLRLGKRSVAGFEVLSGLDAGEVVIVSASSKLKDGMKVNITKSK